MAELIPLPYPCGRSNHYSDRLQLHDFSVTLIEFDKDVYSDSFFPFTAGFSSSVYAEFFFFVFGSEC